MTGQAPSHQPAAWRAPALVGAVGAVSLAAGAWWYAAMSPTSQRFGRTIVAGGDPDEMALTFDDGPNPEVTPRLLDVLAAYGVRATFFMIGRYVRARPDLVRAVSAAGHAIGNHTMSHTMLALRPSTLVRAELSGCSRAIEDVTGQAVRYFRPPFGARRPMVLRTAAELGLETVQWNVTVGDWRPVGAAALLDSMHRGIVRNRALGRGSNLLLHDGGQASLREDRRATVDAVGRLLEQTARAQVRWVTPEAWDPLGFRRPG